MTGTTPLVLVIDDETGSRESMAIALEKAGLQVRTFDDAAKALQFLDENETAALAVCDLRMPGTDGIAFLSEVRRRDLDFGVILVTGFGSIESAVEAMRIGADDYLTKPVDLYELRKRVMNVLENRQLKEEVTTLRTMLDKRYGFESIVAKSAQMERLFEQMRLVAPTRSSVLITGESGTGKELVAKALHQGSPRSEERFLEQMIMRVFFVWLITIRLFYCQQMLNSVLLCSIQHTEVIIDKQGLVFTHRFNFLQV